MPAFILKRLVEALPVLFLVVTFAFFMVRLAPGGPFDREQDMPPQVRASLEAYYGLDRPMGIQYLNYLGHLLRGDLGPSYKYPGWSVNELIAKKFPVSLQLGLLSLMIALGIGISLGALAAVRPGTLLDHVPMAIAMTGICLPTFVLGPVLLLVFGLKLEWFNVMGWRLAGDRVLPSLTLGLFFAAYLARLTRSSMLDVRNQDYMRTARAKGLSATRVYCVHGLRNGLTPVVSYLGPVMAGLLSGSFVVEAIFNIPGLGKFFVQSALDNDYTMVLGVVVFYAVLLILFNLLSDILLILLNPRRSFE